MNPQQALSLPSALNDSKKVSKSLSFKIDQRNAVLHIYNNLGCNRNAVQLIKSFDGYQNLNERRIKRWMKNPDLKSPGRPISEEFEDEVIAECDLSITHKKKKLSATSNRYSYNLVKECAFKVFNKDYWNVKESSFIKKWHFDPRTSKLHFTNKWVVGLLQRDLKKRPTVTSFVSKEKVEEVMTVHDEHDPLLCETVFEHSFVDIYGADPYVEAPSFADCFDAFLDDKDLEELLSDIVSLNHEMSMSNPPSVYQSLDDEVEKMLDLEFDWTL